MKKILLLLSFFVALTSSAQWTSQSINVPRLSQGVEDIAIVDANTVWAKVYDGSSSTPANVQEFVRTTDGGTTWTTGPIPVTDPLDNINDISPIDANTAYAGVLRDPSGAGPYPGSIWKTIDGGATWNQLTLAGFTGATSFLNVVTFFNANVGVAVGDPANTTDFEIYRTTDAGTTWTALPGSSSSNISSGEWGYNGGNPRVGNTFWFVTNKGKIYRSIDMGLTFNSKFNGPTGLTDFAGDAVGGSLYFSDQLSGAAGTNYGICLVRSGSAATATYKMHKTTNGGQTWDAGVTYTHPYRTLAFIPGTTVLVGNGTTSTTPAVTSSAYSTDYGVTWTNIDTGTQRTFLSFFNASTGWAGGFTTATGSGGIFKYTGPALSREDFNTNTVNFSVFPNPSNGIYKIASLTVNVNQVVVFDILGKEVYSNNFDATSEVSVDLTNLNAGAYFMKVVSVEGGIQTIKVIKN